VLRLFDSTRQMLDVPVRKVVSGLDAGMQILK
jgi:hypothetical protein